VGLGRLGRAALFAVVATVGLSLLGGDWHRIWPVVVAIAALIAIDVLSGLAAAAAGLILVWGCLVATGVAPGPGAVAATASRLTEALMSRDAMPGKPTEPTSGTIEERLAKLNDLCGKSLLTAQECAAARARIVDSIARPATVGDVRP